VSLSPEVLQVLLQHRRSFLSFLAPRVGGEAAAEEVLHAALLRGMESGSVLRSKESAVAWFYRLLRNALIDRARGIQRGERALAGLAAERELPGVDARELERTVCACVADLTATLKAEYAQVLRRVDMEDASLAAYAEETGISHTNAKVRLHRARKALASRIEQTCGATCCRRGCADCPCEPV